jgi:hypothetical protein
VRLCTALQTYAHTYTFTHSYTFSICSPYVHLCSILRTCIHIISSLTCSPDVHVFSTLHTHTHTHFFSYLQSGRALMFNFTYKLYAHTHTHVFLLLPAVWTCPACGTSHHLLAERLSRCAGVFIRKSIRISLSEAKKACLYVLKFMYICMYKYMK